MPPLHTPIIPAVGSPENESISDCVDVHSLVLIAGTRSIQTIMLSIFRNSLICDFHMSSESIPPKLLPADPREARWWSSNFLIIYSILCVCTWYMYVHHMHTGSHGCQEASDPLEQEL